MCACASLCFSFLLLHLSAHVGVCCKAGKAKPNQNEVKFLSQKKSLIEDKVTSASLPVPGRPGSPGRLYPFCLIPVNLLNTLIHYEVSPED